MSLMVSPYVVAAHVGPDWAALLPRLVRHGAPGAALTAAVPPRSSPWLFDLLEDRLLLVDPDEYRWWRAQPRHLPLRHETSDDVDVQLLAGAGLLVPVDDAYGRHRYRSLEVEINRHCNYRCRFCPVAADPKPKALMTDELFEVVVARAKEYGIETLSLNHYSEPTLNPRLCSYVTLIAQAGLGIRLHTNAALLNGATIDALCATNAVVCVNLPSVDREEFEAATGARLFDRVMASLDLLATRKARVKLSINAPRATREATVAAINARFGEHFGRSVPWGTDDRAGLIDVEDYATKTRHSGSLQGCKMALWQLNVAHDGKVFLCCQDYQQKVVLGDIRTQTIADIATSPRGVEIRRHVFGADPAPEDFLCRSCSHQHGGESVDAARCLLRGVFVSPRAQTGQRERSDHLDTHE